MRLHRVRLETLLSGGVFFCHTVNELHHADGTQVGTKSTPTEGLQPSGGSQGEIRLSPTGSDLKRCPGIDHVLAAEDERHFPPVMDLLVLRCGMSAEADRNQARLIQKTIRIQASHQWAADRKQPSFKKHSGRSSPFNGLTVGTQ